MKWLLAVIFAITPVLSQAGGIDTAESRKIDYLITAIENLGSAQFIRNGKALHGKVAANNFRLKLKKTRCGVHSAERFIRLCASASWASGVPYKIRFADGKVISAEQYLRQKLVEFGGDNRMDSRDKT
jgi:hypothetical protein